MEAPEPRVTVFYDPRLKAVFTDYGSGYAGAGLSAFVKLAQMKGYQLVRVNRTRTNTVFVRAELGHPHLTEVKPSACFDLTHARFGQRALPS